VPRTVFLNFVVIEDSFTFKVLICPLFLGPAGIFGFLNLDFSQNSI